MTTILKRTCPLIQKECMLAKCAWYFDKQGTCSIYSLTVKLNELSKFSLERLNSIVVALQSK
ncbi:MAG: hypothetical protein ACLP2U_04955 [Syntrophobacteraceae bacterium]